MASYRGYPLFRLTTVRVEWVVQIVLEKMINRMVS